MNIITPNLATGSHYERKKAERKGFEVIEVWRTLTDGPGNNPKVFHQIVSEILQKLKAGKKVAILCFAGVSRSNAVATAVLMALNNISYDKAYKKVRKNARFIFIDPALKELVKELYEKKL